MNFSGCKEGSESFVSDRFFKGRFSSGKIPIIGKEKAPAERVKSVVDEVLSQSAFLVRTGLEKQGVSIYIIDNEEELDHNEVLTEYLFSNLPLELIYINMDGIDETQWEHRGIIAEKIMQLFVYYPLELDTGYAEIKKELENAFLKAIGSSVKIGDRPVYHPRSKYAEPDIAHAHMQPPYYTALGAYLGLAYEVYYGLKKPGLGTREYLPINREEMVTFDPKMVSFLEKYMVKK